MKRVIKAMISMGLLALCPAVLPSSISDNFSVSECRVLIASLMESLSASQAELAILKARGTLGFGEKDILALLSELKQSRDGFLASRSFASGVGFRGNLPLVVDVMEEEGVVLISEGLSAGITNGSMLSIGDTKLVCKVVDSRERLSAAVVQRPANVRLVDLVGCLAMIVTR